MVVGFMPPLPGLQPVMSILLLVANWTMRYENLSNVSTEIAFAGIENGTQTDWIMPTIDSRFDASDSEDEILSILLELDSATNSSSAWNDSLAAESVHQRNATDDLPLSNVTFSTLPPLTSLDTEATTTTTAMPEGTGIRLPDSLLPIQYDLRLTLDSETDLVQGQVRVELQCMRPTEFVRLHLAPDFVQLGHVLLESRLPTNHSLPFRSIGVDWRRQQLSLRMETALRQGHVYYLSIWFSARSSYDGRGLARHRDKQRGIWLNSLFEPSFARRLFPCWDEPWFRAAFRFELWLLNWLAAEDYVALSATDGDCRRWHQNLTICQFAPTPPIPTYLFSLAVGRFHSVCEELKEFEICIWRLAEALTEEGPADWEERARLVASSMAQFQTGMLDYLLANPVARLHLLIVPMKINGMEHFGLLNVRETLWPLVNDSQQAVQRFEKTLFHEMAHQWFGNLVTVEWWDSLWLAESLSTFLSSPRPIVFDPSTDLSETALVDAKWALDSAEGGATPIPGILYTKGPALLEMLDALIGARRMQRLLRTFVRLFHFQSAKTEDFLALLETIMGDDDASNIINGPMVVHFLDRWLQQPSHPIVFVDFDPRLGQVCLSQTPKMEMPNKMQRWPIPVWVECLEGSMPEQLLWIPDDGQLVLPLDILTRTNSTHSLAFNRNRAVYYQLSIRNRPFVEKFA